MTPFDYGYKFVAFLEKHAGGTGRLAANAGTALGGAFKAKPVARAAQAAGAGGVGAGVAGSQNPNVQNAASTLSSQAVDLAARAHVMGQRAFESMPRAVQHYHHAVEHTPVSQALDPVKGVARAMNPVNTTGNLSGLVPHSVTTPIEGAHLAHEGLHGLGHGTAHAGVARH